MVESVKDLFVVGKVVFFFLTFDAYDDNVNFTLLLIRSRNILLTNLCK